MSPILLTALIIGLPTIEGNICSGKFDPAYPHLTNPVPLSHTITFFPSLSMFKISNNLRPAKGIETPPHRSRLHLTHSL
uniref:Putative secreted protein n=1 Tax=Panstrongylus lignarius TaxID=156445 RepID=A0A224Y546_9HEMI